MAGRPWTADEVAAVQECPPGETDLAEVAARIGRTFEAVKHKRIRLAKPPVPRKPRPSKPRRMPGRTATFNSRPFAASLHKRAEGNESTIPRAAPASAEGVRHGRARS